MDVFADQPAKILIFDLPKDISKISKDLIVEKDIESKNRIKFSCIKWGFLNKYILAGYY